VRPAVVDVWVVVMFVVITVVESDDEELTLVVEELCAATGRPTIASMAKTARAHHRRCRNQRSVTAGELIVVDVVVVVPAVELLNDEREK